MSSHIAEMFTVSHSMPTMQILEQLNELQLHYEIALQRHELTLAFEHYILEHLLALVAQGECPYASDTQEDGRKIYWRLAYTHTLHDEPLLPSDSIVFTQESTS